MSWLKDIQSAPPEKRQRVIWIIVGVIAALLIAAWIIVGNYDIKTQQQKSYIDNFIDVFKNFKK